MGVSTVSTGPPSDQTGDITILLGSRTGLAGYVTFPAGLEAMTLTYPNRTTTTQTLDAAWNDSLGPGVATLSISGHTGWRMLKDNRDGKETFLALLDLYNKHVGLMRDEPNSPTSHLLLSDPSSGLTHRCYGQQLQIMRDKGTPLLFQFQWPLVIVKTYQGGSAGVRPTAAGHGTTQTPFHSAPPASSQRASLGGAINSARLAGLGILPGQVSVYTIQGSDAGRGIKHVADLVVSYYAPTSDDQRKRYLAAVLQSNPLLRPSDALVVGQPIWLPNRVA